MKNKIKHLEWVDILRGLAIILIVLGHTIGYSKSLHPLNVYLSSFYVALFFFVSGFVFVNKKEESIKDYTIKKAKRILIPYYIFAFLSLIPFFIFKDKVGGLLNSNRFTSLNFLGSIIGILYGSGHSGYLSQNSPLWFLPCYFTVIIIAKIITSLDKKEKPVVYMIIFALLGFIVSKFFNYSFPYALETALVMLYFFFLGKYIYKYINVSNKKKILIGLLCLIIGFITHLFNGRISAMNNSYNNYLLYLISATNTIIGITYLFSMIKKCNILSYIGKHTIGILCMHKMPILLFQVIPFTRKLLESKVVLISLSTSIIIVLITLVLCLIVDYIIINYLPFMYGKSKNK